MLLFVQHKCHAFRQHVLLKRNTGSFVRGSKYRHTPHMYSRSSRCFLYDPRTCMTTHKTGTDKQVHGDMSVSRIYHECVSKIYGKWWNE